MRGDWGGEEEGNEKKEEDKEERRKNGEEEDEKGRPFFWDNFAEKFPFISMRLKIAF
jgi:hypothetical protein